MQIRKFKGQGMSGILREIKEALGPDAVILLTREMKRRGGDGRDQRILEVTAATEGIRLQEKEEMPPKTAGFESQLEAVVQGDIYKELQSIKGQLLALHEGNGNAATPPTQKMHETWVEMKSMLKSLTASRYDDPFFSTHESLFRLYQQLRSDGIDSEMASQLCHGVKTHLAPNDLQEPAKLHHALKKILSASVEVTGGFESLVSPSGSDLPKALALVGPTGVGKSTTLAKIGATHVNKKQKVILIAFNRIGNGEEAKLSRYGAHFGIPVLCAASIEQLKSILSQRKGDELVLIDTVGCSHLDREGLSQLKGLSDENMPIETHLVVSANAKASDLSDMIDGFSILPIDSLLFTKIDETRHYGPLFSVLGRKRKSVSFLTTGRRVPEDIEAATVKRLSELVLQG